MFDPYDHEPDEFDDRLDPARAGRVEANPDVRVSLSVPVASATLATLESRARVEGRAVEDLVADALRSAAA